MIRGWTRKTESGLYKTRFMIFQYTSLYRDRLHDFRVPLCLSLTIGFIRTTGYVVCRCILLNRCYTKGKYRWVGYGVGGGFVIEHVRIINTPQPISAPQEYIASQQSPLPEMALFLHHQREIVGAFVVVVVYLTLTYTLRIPVVVTR